MYEILNSEGVVIAQIPTIEKLDIVYKGHEFREIIPETTLPSLEEEIINLNPVTYAVTNGE